MFRILSLFLTSFSIQITFAAANCDQISQDTASKMGRDFMVQNKLLKAGEEMDADGVVVEWRALKVKPYGDGCIAVMNASTGLGEKGKVSLWEPGLLYDAVAIKKVGNKWKAVPFKELIKPVDSIKVAIGHADDQDPKDQDYFYADMKGTNAETMQKVIAAGIPVCGFVSFVSAIEKRKSDGSILYVEDGKAPFDPTPGRKWKLHNPKFDLHRGMTAEAYDTRAGAFDGAGFHETIAGGASPVMPWNACFVRRVLENGKWKKVDLDHSLDAVPTAPGGGGGGGGGIGVLSDSEPSVRRSRFEKDSSSSTH